MKRKMKRTEENRTKKSQKGKLSQAEKYLQHLNEIRTKHHPHEIDTRNYMGLCMRMK